MFGSLKSPRQRSRDLPPERGSGTPSRRTRPISRHLAEARDQLNRFSRFFSDRHPQPDPEVEALQGELEQLRQIDRDLRSRFHELEEDIRTTKEKLEAREERRRGEELKRITNELAVAQRFLSTADSLSQAEVVRAMEALNEEIFQLTSIVADMVQVEERILQDEEHQRMFLERISSLGPAFLDVVLPKRLEDPLAIQIGWQALLSTWCCEVIQGWVLENGELNGNIQDMYKAIMTKHGQAVAGRWRSIAREATGDASDSQTREKMLAPVYPTLAALPVSCGCISDKKTYDKLIKAFQQRIGPLLDKCLRFRKMIGEGVTSTDIQPYVVASGNEHDPRSADLEYEDEKDETAKEKQGLVACSLGVGLYSARMSERGPDGKFVNKGGEIVLKPKVILQETLKEIIA